MNMKKSKLSEQAKAQLKNAINSGKTAYAKTQSFRRKSFLFKMIWTLSAVTSYAFGSVFLNGLWGTILSPLEFDTTSLAKFLGGMTAVAITDGAYLLWDDVARRSALSEVQLGWAKNMAHTSFGVSLFYSLIAIAILSYGQYVNAGMRFQLEVGGAVSSIALLGAHILARRVFEANDPEVKRKEADTQKSAVLMQQQLDFEREVVNGATALVALNLEESILELSEQLGDLWEGAVINAAKAKVGIHHALPAPKGPAFPNSGNPNKAHVFGTPPGVMPRPSHGKSPMPASHQSNGKRPVSTQPASADVRPTPPSMPRSNTEMAAEDVDSRVKGGFLPKEEGIQLADALRKSNRTSNGVTKGDRPHNPKA